MACAFHGDLVELYSAINDLTLPVGLSDLVADTCVRFSDKDVAEYVYLAERANNRRLIDIILKGQQIIRSGPPSSIRGILQEYDILLGDPEAKKLARYVAVIRAEDFADYEFDRGIKEEAKSVLRRLGRYTVLGIPCWAGSVVTGIWLIGHREQWEKTGFCYLPLRDIPYGLGNAKAIRVAQDSCFITNHPVVALRFTVHQLFGVTDPVAFVIPWAASHACSIIPVRQLYFLPVPTGQEWFQMLGQSIYLRTSLIVPHWTMKFDPVTGWPEGVQTGPKVIEDLKDLAIPGGQAFGHYLLNIISHEAAKRAQAMRLTVVERNDVVKYFSGQDAHDLRRILDSAQTPQHITIDGQTIVETPNGWMHGESVICSAIIRLMELKTDTTAGTSTITGVVVAEGRQFGFREDLKVINGRPGEWLENFCLSNGIWITLNKKWQGKLLEIAKQFSKSTLQVITTDRPFGWGKDNILRFPRFLVSSEGVEVARSDVDGPDVRAPQPLSGIPQEAFMSHDFCMVSLALLGNLIRTHLGRSGRGILVPGSPHVVERIAGALGVPVERDPVQQVFGNAFSPIPIIGCWSEHGLGSLMAQQNAKNTLLSVDRKTFQLLGTSPDWVRLPVERMTGYESLGWIFHAVPWFIANGFTGKNEDAFYRDLAKIASEGLKFPTTRLLDAGRDLDANWVVSTGSAATLFLRLIHWLVDSGELKVRKTHDGYGVIEEELMASTHSPYLQPLNLKQIRRSMIDAGMLVGIKNGLWEIGENGWLLTKAYQRTVDPS